VIEELRATLARQAERVVPRPDPYHRILLRRRRNRRRAVAALVAIVVIVGIPGGWLASRAGGQRHGTLGTPTPLLRALLDTPTRGSLAGDAVFLAEMRQRAANAGRESPRPKLTAVPTDPAQIPVPRMPVPTDPAKIQVLFAGDLPNGRRLVEAAGDSAVPYLVYFSGPAGTPADQLLLSGGGQLEPILNDQWDTDDGGHEVDLLLGPAGGQIQVSDSARYLADGTVQRTWTARPGDWLLEPADQVSPQARVRYLYQGTLLYEAPLHSAVTTSGHATVDSAPRDGAKPEPVAAQQVADVLAGTMGQVNPPVRYLVLWSDEVPQSGMYDDSSTALVATVLALTADGGGPYATMAFDPADPTASMRQHPTGQGVLGDPDHSLIAMRLPGYPGDPLQVIAPPTAVRVEAVRDGKLVASGPLDRGAGRLAVPHPSTVEVRVYDAAGRLVAGRGYTDNDQGNAGYEPDFKGW
jgi:hypothetical protein